MLAFLVIVIAVGYLTKGDEITTLTFRGVDYVGSGAGGYEIHATDLTPIGNAESMNFPHTESTVYELSGVDTTQVVVAYEGSNRALSMFFKAELFRHQSPESSGVDVLESHSRSLSLLGRIRSKCVRRVSRLSGRR